ncbi:hypothetical protein NBX26_03490 [Mesomycoplasma hyopneumoniae]|uniref:hypothetical protein n=1 Tax=Mesomycoplasma hyopneumoniae TaxID=2099 RepID=UPI003857AAA0
MKKKANFKLLLTKNWIIPSIFSFPFLISAACSNQKQQENKDSLDQNGQDLDKKEQKPAPSILKDQEITKENLDKLPIILKKLTDLLILKIWPLNQLVMIFPDSNLKLQMKMIKN